MEDEILRCHKMIHELQESLETYTNLLQQFRAKIWAAEQTQKIMTANDGARINRLKKRIQEQELEKAVAQDVG